MRTQNMTRRSLLASGSAAAAMLLAACGSARNQEQAAPEADEAQKVEAAPTEDASQAEAAPQQSAQGKILVAYYSRAGENYGNGGTEWLEVGHTKVMAGYITEALGADEYEIVPAQAYPEGYDACCDQAKQEQADDARPAIANPLPDVSGYDVVLIGCPIWWGDEPMIIRTFIEGVDLSGKTVVPFTTHGGSGLGSVPSNLQAAIPGASFLDGLAVAGTSVDGAQDEVVSWAKGLALA
ncbi:MAG: hypothetical protein J6D34_10360 [Atopobiaceae bacterium]|nr:hypothetical protein [Atopobiaceae bacterium]